MTRRFPRLMVPRPFWRRFATPWLAALMLSLLTACQGESLGPDPAAPPYLAVVTRVEAGSLIDEDIELTYRVVDVSEGGVLDTLVTLQLVDTLILSVRPATYEVRLMNLPSKCTSRYGPAEFVVIPENTNTAIARFFVTCNAPLSVSIYTAGGPDTLGFVWELTAPGKPQRTGLITTKDATVTFNPLDPGQYTFTLWNLPSNCEVVSGGRRRQTVDVTAAGGALLQFAVTCSVSENRPVITDFVWSYHDSAAVFIANVTDSDRNLLGYYFDITDCNGRTRLPGGEIGRGGLNSGRTALMSPAMIIGGFELSQLGVSDAALTGSCASLRVVDDFGNTTIAVERPPLAGGASAAPYPTRYNAVLIGTSRLATQLEVADDDGDFAGVFVAAILRDGVLRSPDGHPDIGIYNTQGYDTPQIPDLALGGRITSSDVYAQIIYLVDAKGHFRRVVDRDPFR